MRFVIILTLASALVPLAPADVLRVGPGELFAEVADAVAAATDGDLILVAPGTYATFSVDDKALWIAGTPGARFAQGQIAISGLQAGKALRMTGFSNQLAGVRLLNCAGSVRLQDWVATARFWPLIDAQGCDRVTLVELRGHPSTLESAVPGLAASGSQIAVYDGRFTGSPGDPKSGAGAELDGSFVLASAGTFRGGEGIDGESCGLDPTYPTAGGDGARILYGSHLVSIGTSFLGGEGGFDYCGPPAANGVPVAVEGSTHDDVIPAYVRRMSGPSIVQEDDEFTITFFGRPGDQVTLLEGADEIFQYDAGLAGVRHLDPATATATFVGVIPSGGQLSYTLPSGLPPIGEHLERRFQMIVDDVSGATFLGSSLDVAVFDYLGVDVCHPVYHVRKGAAPGGDGESWATAFGELADALILIAAAHQQCPGLAPEVWIAAGTYTPSPVRLDPVDRFFVSSGTQLYGGFAGTETSRDERDPVLNRTILSGDLLGNDGPDFSGYDENSYSIVWTFDAVLDGLVVSGARNAGIYNPDGDDLVVRRCEVRENLNTGTGGAGYRGLYGTGRAFFADTLFYRNRTTGRGAGLYSYSNAYIVNCRFVENESLQSGGGAYFPYHPMPGVVAGSVFIGNRGSIGGGIGLDHIYAGFEIVNCTLVANEATLRAGGVELDGDSVSIYGSLFWRNSVGGVQDEAAQLAGDPAQIGFSLVQGWTGALGGIGNFHGDPRFVDMDGPDDMLGNLDDDLRLQFSSVCIDAGRFAALPMDLLDLDGDDDFSELLPLDLDGMPRVVGQTRYGTHASRFRVVDIGAYEAPHQ